MKEYLTLIGLLVATMHAGAHSQFSRGDAYIAFRLDRKLCDILKAGGPLVFDGNFGTVRLSGDTEGVRRQLIGAYERYRSVHDANLIVRVSKIDDTGEVHGRLVKEIDSLYCFIYNRDYPLENRLIGFKYNEGWMLEPGENDDGPERVLFRDWMYRDNYKFAKTVPGLEVSENEGVYIADVNKICIVVIMPDHLMRFLDRAKSIEDITVTRIDTDGFVVFQLIRRFGKYLFERASSYRESTEFGRIPELDSGL